ncbi:hypothetical protein [Amorphus orientalis]|uniref:Uncharacterized protein n=1 Tax=Amorphus orientalis TaxID=649198 RepID=A0AAE3VS41_9HYPH|nr:hypothetical protein [Amorphus orientalis]MDQ0317754.1 hypothetical protein [Amorphus orientalis]
MEYPPGIVPRQAPREKLDPEVTPYPRKSMLVRIAPNRDDMEPNLHSPDAKWIRIEGISIREFRKVKSVADRYLLIRDKIPAGWHPIGFERKGGAR